MGHFSRDCTVTYAVQTVQATDQVHAIIALDSRGTRDLVIGILLICGYSMHTLIDSGSTVSFISGGMVDMLGLRPIRVKRHLVLSTAIGDRIYPNLIYERCIMIVERYNLPIDL